MPPTPGCPGAGPPSSEVTGAFCRVPSTPFSQAPGYALPVHLCRFRVRSLIAGAVSRKSQAARSIQSERTTFGLRHIPAGGGMLTPFPSATAFALALGARLTLRGLTLRRNPWTFGVRVSHPHYRYSCQHSHFRCLQQHSHATFTGLRNAPLPRARQRRAHPQLRCVA